MIESLDRCRHLLVDSLVYLLLPLFKNLVIHRHVSVNLAEEVRIELELKLIIIFR